VRIWPDSEKLKGDEKQIMKATKYLASIYTHKISREEITEAVAREKKIRPLPKARAQNSLFDHLRPSHDLHGSTGAIPAGPAPPLLQPCWVHTPLSSSH
jgi:hypothetical protein